MSDTAQTQKKGNGWLVILMIGAFFTVLSTTVMSNVIPVIMNEFDVSTSAAQWLTTMYMLIAAILVPTSAFLMSRFSIRTLYLSCMAIFTVGTLIAGFAPTFSILLIARAIQAIGASIIMPLLMNILFKAFPEEKRGKAMGLFGLVLIFAPAIGPTFAGLILEVANWNVIFHIIWPISLIVLIISYMKIEKDPKPTGGPFDLLSVILSAIGFGTLIYGFSNAGSRGWDDAIVLTCIAVGVVGLILFIVRQTKLEHPMLNFGIFLNKQFTISIIVFCTVVFAMYSVMITVPIYLQTVRGLSPLTSGLLMMPGSILMGLLMPINGKLYDRFGVKPLLLIGSPLMIFASIMFSNLTITTSYAFVCIAYIIRLVGVGIVQVPMQTNAMNSLTEKEITHGSAMVNTLQQLVGAISTSLIITMISTRSSTHGEELAAEALKNGQTLTDSLKVSITNEAMILGNNDAFIVTIFVAVIGLVVGLFIKNRKGLGKAGHH